MAFRHIRKNHKSMPKSPENFNFSKAEDQKEFIALPEEIKKDMIDEAHRKAIWENEEVGLRIQTQAFGKEVLVEAIKEYRELSKDEIKQFIDELENSSITRAINNVAKLAGNVKGIHIGDDEFSQKNMVGYIELKDGTILDGYEIDDEKCQNAQRYDEAFDSRKNSGYCIWRGFQKDGDETIPSAKVLRIDYEEGDEVKRKDNKCVKMRFSKEPNDFGYKLEK